MFPFGKAHFQVRLLLVLGRVKWLGGFRCQVSRGLEDLMSKGTLVVVYVKHIFRLVRTEGRDVFCSLGYLKIPDDARIYIPGESSRDLT